MATNDKYLKEIFPKNSSAFVNDNRYTNFNLNQQHKCNEKQVDTVKSTLFKNEKPKEQREQNDYHLERSAFFGIKCEKRLWDSDEKISLEKLKPDQPKLKTSSKTSGSTLSLHIAAYEAAIELLNPKLDDDQYLSKAEKSKKEFKKKLQKKIYNKQYFLEFPRQQEEDATEPQIMQFKASQKLINPTDINENEGPAAKRQKHAEKNTETNNSSLPTQATPSSSTSTHPSHIPTTTPKLSTIRILPTPSTTGSSRQPQIRILSSPSTPSSSRPKFIAPKKPTVSMDWENYEDPDPEIRKFAEEQKRKQTLPPEPPKSPEPPKPPKTREEILLEEIERLTAENARVKGELKTANHYISNKKYEERKAQKRSEKDDDNDSNSEERNFDDLPKTTRYRIINDIWDKLQQKHSPNMAAQIITAIYNQKVQSEERSLTPAQTLQMLKDSGISIRSLRKIRSSLNNFDVPNPFASDVALNRERARIHESVKFKKEKVMMSNTTSGPKVETDVYYRESVFDELQERIDGIISAGNYQPFYVDGEEVIAAVLTKDKATEYSKFCMGVGNTKAPINSPRGLSLLAYFKANDSQENIYAAYDRENGIGPQVDNIKEITVTINGETKTLPVKWFVTGDFKFLNAVAGLNSNSCSFPCWNCEQKSETTFAELDLNLNAPKREPKIDPSKSQIREPLFKSIPFDRFIPPVLHITLGSATQLFEALCKRATELDNAGEIENIPEMLTTDKARKSWEESQDKMEKLQQTLDDLNHKKSLFENNNDEEAQTCQSNNCVAIRDGINVNNVYELDRYCYECLSTFHKPCLYKGHCPHCVNKYPTPKQSKAVIDQDHKDIDKQIKQTLKAIKEEEEKIASIVSKFKLGSLAKNLEQVLQYHGGSRKVFFQSFTGKQLTAMGEKIREIYFKLDERLQNDPEIRKITRAIIKFFDMKKLLTTKILENEDIDAIEEKIKEFAEYMKEHLPHFRVLHKGHTLFKHYVDFMRKYKIAAYFSDEAIESFHVIFNRYDRRINNRSPDKYAELIFKYNKEDTYIFDRFAYVDDDEE